VRRVPFLFLSTVFGLIAQVIVPPVPGSPTTLQVVSGSGQNAVVNTEYAQPMTVRVLDANDIAVPGVTVTFTFPTPSAFSIPASVAAPGLFTASDSQAMAFNEDRTLNSDASAAPRGGVLTLYGTGIGDGSLAPIAVNIGGEAAALLSVAPVADMPGVTMLKVRVPRFSGTGSKPVELLAGTETAGATIVVQ